MKKIVIAALLCSIMLGLCSCGASTSEPASETPEPTAPAGMTSVLPGSAETDNEEPESAENEMTESSPDMVTAKSLIGHSVKELVEAIGEPSSKEYASSCLGSGEDGEWVYDGFIVYTYKENDSETVEDVE